MLGPGLSGHVDVSVHVDISVHNDIMLILELRLLRRNTCRDNLLLRLKVTVVFVIVFVFRAVFQLSIYTVTDRKPMSF